MLKINFDKVVPIMKLITNNFFRKINNFRISSIE